MPADIHGILLLDKPLGLSSAGAVVSAGSAVQGWLAPALPR